MTTWFVSRHPGACQWIQSQGIQIDQQVSHLDPDWIRPGDRVLGNLPVNLAAEVSARGARYFHLSIQVPSEFRGKELTEDQLIGLGARLQEFRVLRAILQSESLF